MKTKRPLFLLFLLLFNSIFVIAQPRENKAPAIGMLQGQVIDKNSDENIEYATITLHSNRTKKLVTGTVSNEEGHFKITEIPMGSYKITISFIGFLDHVIAQQKFTPDSPSINLRTISLKVDMKVLSSIIVQDEKPLIENMIDKKVVNVQQMVGSESSTALEVLENIPSVEVDIDGNLSLRGSSNVKILIDGKPAGISDDESSILDQLPTNAIETIEVITNPSAKYDADGVSGIINIKLKKNKVKGYNGSMNAGIGTMPNYNGGVDLGYRNGILNIYGSYNLRYDERTVTGESNNTYWNAAIPYQNQDIRYNRAGDSHLAKFGFDVDITEKSSLGYYTIASKKDSDRDKNLDYKFYSDDLLLDSWQNIYTDRNYLSHNLSHNLNYLHEFDNSDHYIKADINYLNNVFIKNLDITDTYLQLPTDSIREQMNDLDNLQEEYILSIDYSHILKDSSRIELGGRSIFRDIKNSFYGEFYDSNTMNWQTADSINDTFIYLERIHAIYGIYKGKWGNRIAYQAGLRLESAHTDGRLTLTGDHFTQTYYGAFPSFHSSYTLSKTKELNLNYSRRIKRPTSSQLNPFDENSDPYQRRAGNPNLVPEYINSIEGTLQHTQGRNILTSTLYYRQTNNPIQRTIQLDTVTIGIDTSFVSIIQINNLGYRKTLGAEFVALVKPKQWWNINANFNIYQMHLLGDADGTQLENEAVNWNIRLNQTFRLPQDFTIQLSTNYFGKRIIAQGYINPMYMADASIKKKILDGKGTLSLRLSDIFNTRKFTLVIDQETFTREIWRKRKSQAVTLSFTYNFGNLEEKPKRKRSNYQEDPSASDVEM